MTTTTYTQTTSPLHRLPADHPAWGLIRQCMEISSGTLAVLIDSSLYTEVYVVRANWLDYLAEHAALVAELASWSECWWLFWDTSHA